MCIAASARIPAPQLHRPRPAIFPPRLLAVQRSGDQHLHPNEHLADGHVTRKVLADGHDGCGTLFDSLSSVPRQAAHRPSFNAINDHCHLRRQFPRQRSALL